jgi:hypothetical protein
VPDPTDFGYAGFSFAWGDHICAIFENRVQQMEIMGAFIATGIRAEQRCVWVSPEESAAGLRQTLADMGGDLATLEASNQLLVLSELDFYLQGGVFEPDRTLDLLAALAKDNEREGYRTMRVANDVSWLTAGRVDVRLWEDFEGRLTQEVAGLPLVMVCQYDHRQLSGEMIVTAMRTHPSVILGDTFRRNPFYVPAGATASDGTQVV